MFVRPSSQRAEDSSHPARAVNQMTLLLRAGYFLNSPIWFLPAPMYSLMSSQVLILLQVKAFGLLGTFETGQKSTISKQSSIRRNVPHCSQYFSTQSSFFCVIELSIYCLKQ